MHHRLDNAQGVGMSMKHREYWWDALLLAYWLLMVVCMLRGGGPGGCSHVGYVIIGPSSRSFLHPEPRRSLHTSTHPKSIQGHSEWNGKSWHDLQRTLCSLQCTEYSSPTMEDCVTLSASCFLRSCYSFFFAFYSSSLILYDAHSLYSAV